MGHVARKTVATGGVATVPGIRRSNLVLAQTRGPSRNLDNSACIKRKVGESEEVRVRAPRGNGAEGYGVG
jgi:hypothetical protein